MIRVIAVDDEKTIREGIGRFVRETEGFELLATCADGGEAYDKILAKHPDLVICDIIMPVFDGIEPVSYTHLKPINLLLYYTILY